MCAPKGGNAVPKKVCQRSRASRSLHRPATHPHACLDTEAYIPEPQTSESDRHNLYRRDNRQCRDCEWKGCRYVNYLGIRLRTIVFAVEVNKNRHATIPKKPHSVNPHPVYDCIYCSTKQKNLQKDHLEVVLKIILFPRHSNSS